MPIDDADQARATPRYGQKAMEIMYMPYSNRDTLPVGPIWLTSISGFETSGGNVVLFSCLGNPRPLRHHGAHPVRGQKEARAR